MTFIYLLISFNSVYVQVGTGDMLRPNAFEGLKLELNGVVICDEIGNKIHDKKLKNQLKKDPTVAQLIKVLGPGYISPNSGTGGLRWYFDDDSVFFTNFWPRSLSEKVKKDIPGDD